MPQRIFRFEYENHTLGNLLCNQLSTMPDVEYVGYDVDDDGTWMRLCIESPDPVSSLTAAAEVVRDHLVAVHQSLLAECMPT